jgi:hypothetical protein
MGVVAADPAPRAAKPPRPLLRAVRNVSRNAARQRDRVGVKPVPVFGRPWRPNTDGRRWSVVDRRAVGRRNAPSRGVRGQRSRV